MTDPRNTWLAMFQHVRVNVSALHTERTLWRGVSQALQAVAPDSSGIWLQHYARLYLAAQTMTLRRLTRAKGVQEASLGRLLTLVEKHPELAERSALSDPALAARQARGWLNEVTQRLIPWATLKIAHLAMNPPESFTWGELNEAIDAVTDIFDEWGINVTGVHHVIDPLLPPNWPDALAKPLFRLTENGWDWALP